MKTKVMKSLLAVVMCSATLSACSSSTASSSKSANGSGEVIFIKFYLCTMCKDDQYRCI